MLLSREQVRQLDRRAIDEYGIPALVLMENAGRGVADVLVSLGHPGPVVICCGKGNNGGDGLVAARHLVNRGWAVKVFLFAAHRNAVRRGWGSLAYRAAHAHPRRSARRRTRPMRSDLAEELNRAAWIVDALFGTGLTGPLRPPFDQIVALINASEAKMLAVDIPSGLDANTGQPLGPTIRADHTVTFVAAKKGFANPEAVEFLGILHIIDIGVSAMSHPTDWCRSIMIRPTLPADTPELLDIIEKTGVFKPLEIQALREVLDDYHAENHEVGHRSVTYEKDGRLLGFAYYAPAAMTVGTWHLWWIVVRQDLQARGIGSEMLKFVEGDILARKGPGNVHRNGFAAALRTDAALLPQARLRAACGAERLLRCRGQPGSVSQGNVRAATVRERGACKNVTSSHAIPWEVHDVVDTLELGSRCMPGVAGVVDALHPR